MSLKYAKCFLVFALAIILSSGGLFFYLTKKNRENSQQFTWPSVLSQQIMNDFFSKAEKTPEDYIIIPKIQVQAPVAYNVGLEQTEILLRLPESVVFYANSRLPDEEGLAVYFGHSANYWWHPGRYNQVFKEIDQLQTGDKIYNFYAGREYVYEVRDKTVLNKKDWGRLDHSPVSIGLALITCWPVGTTRDRYVVWASRVDSD